MLGGLRTPPRKLWWILWHAGFFTMATLPVGILYHSVFIVNNSHWGFKLFERKQKFNFIINMHKLAFIMNETIKLIASFWYTYVCLVFYRDLNFDLGINFDLRLRCCSIIPSYGFTVDTDTITDRYLVRYNNIRTRYAQLPTYYDFVFYKIS